MIPDKTKSLLRLVRLMTESEKEVFLIEFGLGINSSDNDILETIGKLPKYETVRAFLRVADATLKLLKDIFEILESFGIATRTTGCIFVIANPTKPEERTEIAFSQQIVGALCSWSPTKKWNQASSSILELQENWKRLYRTFRRLTQNARPTGVNEQNKLFRIIALSQNKWHKDKDDPAENAQKVLRYFAESIKRIVTCLSNIQDTKRPEELTTILGEVRRLETIVAKMPKPLDSQQPPQYIIECETSPTFATEVDKFIEDIYLLSDIINGEDAIDLLQINIWSARHQLYEIWVLLNLLRWIRGRGSVIKFLKTENIGDSLPFRWNLSYSNDKKPCAEIHQRDGSKRFLFYQLYRPSKDMPDISLLENDDPSSSPVWSIDPKHSEKDGYSLQAYKATAIRYRDSFGAKLSLVVEYFDRPDLDNQSMEFGPCAKLIRGCRPNGAGLRILFSELAEFHSHPSQILVCIDFSESFNSNRQLALESLKQWLKNCGQPFAHEYICFAGNALIQDGFDKWVNSEGDSPIFRPNLSQGTEFAPLFIEIMEVQKQALISEIILVSDGRFELPIKCVISRIESELSLKVTVFNSYSAQVQHIQSSDLMHKT